MFHCALKVLSRSGGRSASGAAAYLAAATARDPWTDTSFDYQKKTAPSAVGYVNSTASEPAEFGAALDSAENRKNSSVAREVIIALPDSLAESERVCLAEQIAGEIAARWDVPTMFAIHRPDRGGDQRNQHVHVLFGTRDKKGKKTRVLDEHKTGEAEVAWLRQLVSGKIQAALPAQEWAAWDHRSLAERGVERPPQKHEGPMVSALRRKGVSLEAAKHNDQVRELCVSILGIQNELYNIEQINATAAIDLSNAAIARATEARRPTQSDGERARSSTAGGFACDAIAQRARKVSAARRADRAKAGALDTSIVDSRRAERGPPPPGHERIQQESAADHHQANDQRRSAAFGGGITGAGASAPVQNPAAPTKVSDERIDPFAAIAARTKETMDSLSKPLPSKPFAERQKETRAELNRIGQWVAESNRVVFSHTDEKAGVAHSVIYRGGQREKAELLDWPEWLQQVYQKFKKWAKVGGVQPEPPNLLSTHAPAPQAKPVTDVQTIQRGRSR